MPDAIIQCDVFIFNYSFFLARRWIPTVAMPYEEMELKKRGTRVHAAAVCIRTGGGLRNSFPAPLDIPKRSS